MKAVTHKLVGRWVDLVALDPSHHALPLYSGTHGAEREALWHHLRNGPLPDAQTHQNHLARLCASDLFSGYAIVNRCSAAVLGQAALMKLSSEHLSAEIGYVLFLPALQRTRGGTEALFLLMQYAFEVLKLRRCEWRCDSRNLKSERAALRLGFEREGLMRNHMIVKGRSRDTLIFSMLARGWSDTKADLASWLADENFNSDGTARKSLGDVRGCRRFQNV